MRFGRIGRAARVFGYVFISSCLVVLGSKRELARAEVEKREATVDRPEPADDDWRGSRHPVWLHSRNANDAPLLVYPPEEATKPAPLVVLLHGMCGHPENECPWFAGAPTSSRYLVCPRADLGCPGDGAIWSSATRARRALLAGMRERIERAYPNQVGANRTLIGFSLGAFVALDVAQESHGEWNKLLLIGAFVKPDAEKLKAAGVESVLFASGDWDVSRDEMKRQARKLARLGVRARYAGMGPMGHWFAKDMDSWLAEALEWLDTGK